MIPCASGEPRAPARSLRQCMMSGQVEIRRVDDILSTEGSTILGLKPGTLGSRRGALRASGLTPVTFDLLAPRDSGM